MRLAITVDPLDVQMGGIGRYTLELIKGLRQRAEVQDLRYYRHGRWIADPLALLRGEVVGESSPGWLPRGWHRHRDLRRHRSHLFHGTNFFLPAEAEQGVITIHDLSVLRFPELHPVERVRAYEREFARSVQRAAHILTPSETIRQEVVEYLGAAPDRVLAIPLAASREYRPRSREELAPLLKAWDLTPGSYGLSVSTIEPRKKLEQSLAAWSSLPPAVGRRWPLVVAGGAGWGNTAIRERIQRGRAEGWLRDLGYVPEEQLPTLYAGARILLYPSAYEGFGLPVVEAMASGVPCLISPNSCLAEVTQGAALAVDPDDILDYAEKTEKALTDEGWRASVIANGLRVAASYSWDRCVSETLAVYRMALNSSCGSGGSFDPLRGSARN
jgi:alpha-1,3-rhamnosyl/mannosyltransferase